MRQKFEEALYDHVMLKREDSETVDLLMAIVATDSKFLTAKEFRDDIEELNRQINSLHKRVREVAEYNYQRGVKDGSNAK